MHLQQNNTQNNHTQFNQHDIVDIEHFHAAQQNLFIAMTCEDPKLKEEAWAAIFAARAETAQTRQEAHIAINTIALTAEQSVAAAQSEAQYV